MSTTMSRLPTLDELRALPAPMPCGVKQIEPHWVDHNGHLNMAFYNVVMDESVGALFRPIGLGASYRKERNGSTMTAECHVRYLREVRLGDPLQVFIRLLGADEKRIHFFQELRHATEGWLSATSENITLHIDMRIRRVAPFPPDIAERVQAVVAVHSRLQLPEGAGRRIGLPAQAPVA